jgi:hypothetical protein
LTDDLQVHPADVLAQQLERVTGLIRILGDLYSPQHESFATGNGFIAHGLVAISSLLNDAQGALENLHQVCDLQMVSDSPRTESDNTASDPIAEDDELMIFPPEKQLWPQDDIVVPEADAVEEAIVAQSSQASDVPDDQFAQSYLELLRKLTAAEVFAAEQQALAPPGSGQNLLPLLRSLREEFQKLHRVA